MLPVEKRKCTQDPLMWQQRVGKWSKGNCSLLISGFYVTVKSIWLLELVFCTPHLHLPEHSIGLKFNQISWFVASEIKKIHLKYSHLGYHKCSLFKLRLKKEFSDGDKSMGSLTFYFSPHFDNTFILIKDAWHVVGFQAWELIFEVTFRNGITSF